VAFPPLPILFTECLQRAAALVHVVIQSSSISLQPPFQNLGTLVRFYQYPVKSLMGLELVNIVTYWGDYQTGYGLDDWIF
jgi:hypothetical protein